MANNNREFWRSFIRQSLWLKILYWKIYVFQNFTTMQSLHHLEIVGREIRRIHRFFWRFLSKTTSCYKQETSSRHWIPGQYGRPPHQPQLNSTVSHLCSLRTRGAPSVAGVKSLCIIGRASSSQEGCSADLESSKESLFPRFWSQKTATNKRTIAPRTNYFAFLVPARRKIKECN